MFDQAPVMRTREYRAGGGLFYVFFVTWHQQIERRLEPFVAVRARPLPAMPVALVVEHHDAVLHRWGFVGKFRGWFPIRVDDVESWG